LLEPLGEYDPAGHLSHIWAPFDWEKDPAGQALQVLEPGGDQNPGPQGLQEVSRTPWSALDVPAGQSLQGFRP
jgi:hypothetical protein